MLAVFERLAQNVEHVPMKLGQLVQEEDAVVRETDFPGTRCRTAPDEAGIGNRVVRSAERSGGDQSIFLGKEPGDGVNLRGFDCFFEGHGR